MCNQVAQPIDTDTPVASSCEATLKLVSVCVCVCILMYKMWFRNISRCVFFPVSWDWEIYCWLNSLHNTHARTYTPPPHTHTRIVTMRHTEIQTTWCGLKTCKSSKNEHLTHTHTHTHWPSCTQLTVTLLLPNKALPCFASFFIHYLNAPLCLPLSPLASPLSQVHELQGASQ